MTSNRRPHNLRSIQASALSCLLLFSFFQSPLPAESLYRPPNMEKEIFNTKGVKLDKFTSAQLVSALVSVAADFSEEEDGIDYTLRAQALAIAGRINPDSKKFKSTGEQLVTDGETISDTKATPSRTANLIYSGARSLARGDNPDNKKCAAYCVDIALNLDPDGKRSEQLQELKETLDSEGFEPDWSGLLGDAIERKKEPRPWWQGGEENTFAERTETMPGGTAEKFAQKQSSVYGLVVITLDNGKHAGAASEIIATALRDEGTDNLKFKLNQKVGSMMANSLESIINFLRVTYEDTDLVPSGYSIDIVFEDKNTLTDGPSAGAAITLLLESLLTGEKLDPEFACTGGITPNGKVTRIGGVAAKIRGATRRDCTIVGIPKDNADAVADNLILSGLEQLINIQIFSMETIEEARAISRAEKDSTVQEALDAFQAVADLVNDEGEDMIKNQAVQKKLEDVLEKMPNHLSAKYLLDYAKGEAPTRLTVGGSFHEIDSNASGVFATAEMMSWREQYEHSTMIKDTAKDAVRELSKLEGKVDARMDDYLKDATEVCKLILEGKGSDDEETFLKRLTTLWESVRAKRKKLLDDPQLREEIMG